MDKESENIEFDPRLAYEMASHYGTVSKVIAKPRPYQNSCFVKMGNVIEAGRVKKALDGHLQSKIKCWICVKFFSSPDLKQKLERQTGNNPPMLKQISQVKEYLVPPRCLQTSYQKGCQVSEMPDYMIFDDPHLSKDY
jgi:hypothetical protein